MEADDYSDQLGREKLTWPEWFGCLAVVLACVGACGALRWWLF